MNRIAIIDATGKVINIIDNSNAVPKVTTEVELDDADTTTQVGTQLADFDANAATLINKAKIALTANATYLAIGSPTNPQVAAQVVLLTRECNGLIRLVINQLDSIAGT